MITVRYIRSLLELYNFRQQGPRDMALRSTYPQQQVRNHLAVFPSLYDFWFLRYAYFLGNLSLHPWNERPWRLEDIYSMFSVIELCMTEAVSKSRTFQFKSCKQKKKNCRNEWRTGLRLGLGIQGLGGYVALYLLIGRSQRHGTTSYPPTTVSKESLGGVHESL